MIFLQKFIKSSKLGNSIALNDTNSRRTFLGCEFRHLKDLLEVNTMCRNIRTLYNFEPPATENEIRAAALQYVRKISGFTKPSKANLMAFDEAVDAITVVSSNLLVALETKAPPKDRAVERAKAKARSAKRFSE